MAALFQLRLDPTSGAPIYRQLALAVEQMISIGTLASGERLPPTRELAGQLGLNRTTVSAAYALLEQNGLIKGQVGRGSFVAALESSRTQSSRDWEAILPPSDSGWRPARQKVDISFASSSPVERQLPLTEFRRLSKQVIDSPEAADILQLGSSLGYPPLRRYLLNEAVSAGIARPTDDLIVTNGCQQALDLIARLFASPGSTVVLEDPVYHGLLRVFGRTGAELVGLHVDDRGINPDQLEQVLSLYRPKLLIITPSFQNPTGSTLPLERRRRIVELTERFSCVLVESDIYSDLRYAGSPLPTLKQLDETGNTILLRSYSKIAFPGLRVGWVIAPRPVIARLAEAKEISDLHSDQLSQAVLLRFAESGELARHLDHTLAEGALRLSAVLNACGRFLPPGTRWTRPEGGLNLWIELPAPLTAENILSRAQSRGVTFLPGRLFSTRRSHGRALRISFGGLSPDQINRGIQILGEAAESELLALEAGPDFEPTTALV